MIVDRTPQDNPSVAFQRPGLSFDAGRYGGYNPLFAGNQPAYNRAADWNWVSLYFSSLSSSMQSGAAINTSGQTFQNLRVFGLSLPDQPAGQILFPNSLNAVTSSPSLFWDNTNGRLCVGASNPQYPFEVRSGPIVDNSVQAVAGFQNSVTAYNANPVTGIAFAVAFNSSGTRAGVGGVTSGKENAIDGDVAGYLAFHTRPTGGNLTETARIDSTGQFISAAIRAKGGPWFDVKAYGAKGDGVTDDSTAIQAAITAAAVSGGTVFFPAATYLFATALTCTVRNVKFLGAGKRATILNYTGSGVALTIGNGTPGNSDGIAVVALSIVGTSSGTVGLDIIQSNSFLVEHVRCSGFSTGKAFRVNGSNTGTVIESDFGTSSIGVSLESNGGLTPNLVTFIGGSCQGNATAVSSLALAKGIRFIGMEFESNTASPCIAMNQAIGWLFEGCWFEGNFGGANTYCIELGASVSSDNNSFISNYLAETNVTYFLHITTGVNNLVLGNANGSTGMTAIVRCETFGHATQIAFNMNQSGSGVLLSDGSGAVDQFQVGFGSTFTKDAYGYSFNLPLVGTASAALFLRARAAGQNAVTYQDNSGVSTGGITEKGAFVGPVNCLTKTASTYAIPASERNTEYDNSGAGAQVAFTLPAATVGLQYAFVVLTAQNIRILGNGAETIQVAGSTSTATTGHIDNATSGGVIRLVCHVAGTWIATYSIGTWTVT